MNYNNLLIIKDNTIYYNKIELELNNSILFNGIIINKEKFINSFIKFLKQNKISTFFWNKEIIIVYDNNISINDIKVINDIFIELNYKKIKLISDINLLDLSKNNYYLICLKNYKFIYVDEYNFKKVITFNLNNYTLQEIKKYILKRLKNKNLFIIGKCSIIFDNNINYYNLGKINEIFYQKLNIGK